jgi:hypothetical protein
MDEPAKKESASRSVALSAGLAVALVLPILYVLSIGPAVWLSDQGYTGDPESNPIYRPLVWLVDTFPTFEEFIDWYVDLWST